MLDTLSAGTMTKFSWRRESFLTTSVWLKMDYCPVLSECFSRRVLRFRTSPIDFRKSVNFDVFFLCPPSGLLFTCIHDNAKVLVPWIWDRFPVFWALAQKISLIYITYYIEITCHYTWSVQNFWIWAVARWGWWERPWMSSSYQLTILEAT